MKKLILTIIFIIILNANIVHAYDKLCLKKPPPNIIPEPCSVLMMLTGCFGIFMASKKKGE